MTAWKKGLLMLSVMMLSAVMLLSPGTGRAEEPDQLLGRPMPDFTAACVDGTTFTLSEALREKELVLVNFWATWCGWCRVEFPMLEEAYNKYKDRVAVIGLSVSETDTPEIIRDFAGEYGLTFPMAPFWERKQLQMVTEELRVTGYPTTFVVDRSGSIVFMEVGSMPSAALFSGVFDALLSPDRKTGDVLTEAPGLPEGALQLLFIRNDFSPVAGVNVSLTVDGSVYPFVSDEHGSIFSSHEPGAVSEIRIDQIPDGLELLSEEPMILDAGGRLLLYPVDFVQ